MASTEILFTDVDNKDANLKQIKGLQLSDSTITKTANSYEQGPGPHAKQSPWKFAPKDDGLGVKVTTQANV